VFKKVKRADFANAAFCGICSFPAIYTNMTMKKEFIFKQTSL
jgi:hypothetical protein